MFDAVIIGAGVCGALIARTLTEYGQKVCILEKAGDVAMGTTKANSAIVHAGFDAKPGTLKAKLNVKGSEMMEGFCRSLGVKYSPIGALVVGFNDGDRRTLETLLARGVENGVKELRILEGEELKEIEPNLGEQVCCALYAPSSAIVCPYELCIAAAGNAMDNGAELRLNFMVKTIEKDGEGFVVSDGNESVRGHVVINCAGVHSAEIAGLVGDNSFTITPRKGEYMLLDKECGSLVSHTVFRCPSAMGKGILVSPTVDGNLLLGPTAVNIEDMEDFSVSAEGIAAVRESAAQQVKGIAFNKVIASFAGLRSVGSTGDFILNEPVKGFINVAAIESPGLSSAPAIAEYVREMLAADGVKLEKRADFVSERRSVHYYKTLSTEEKNALIAEHPEYGHIICRCETVSEGEILEALRRNPRPTDVDGVKRRTRATMGRCQGGFCTPYIVELLAKELGSDCTEVTKFGGDSHIIIEKTKVTE
ncbi:MAG: NAD(P)/FAD-dependent oxidoreductase [Clostridia bacterium]|nr:NAD(P)/FAD-dependent oxidoreductase [Clostridia bacterium]